MVLIPAYNEEFQIGETLLLYQDYLSCQQGERYVASILVADDGSTDETARVVRQIAASENTATAIPIKCVLLPVNGGKGAALAFGIHEIARQ